jgi:TPR repeat protein
MTTMKNEPFGNISARYCFIIILVLTACCSLWFFVIKAPTTSAVDVHALVKKAESGDAEAQNRLGFCYAKGEGLLKDDVLAVSWYRKAAEQGYAKAQFNLGVCYSKGRGVPLDAVEAVRWYRKSVEQGYAGAQCNLGLCYFNGDGCPATTTVTA